MNRVFFVSSEVYPYSKTGGLGDVSGALPKTIRKLGRAEMITITPYYEGVIDCDCKLERSEKSLSIFINDQNYEIEVWVDTQNSGIYFLRNEFLFGRKEIYGSYMDNYMRFGLLCYGAIELALQMGLNKKDIFHLNDWQSALVPFLLQYRYGLKNRTILTIHNIAYQGIFPKDALNHLGIKEDAFYSCELEYFGDINFLKAGIIYSTCVTTVSRSYLEEIEDSFGFGLEGVVKRYREKFCGILNGIDKDIWDPGVDKNIYKKFVIERFDAKAHNRKALLKALGFKAKEQPLYGIITRLVPQKGVGYILELLKMAKGVEANFVIIGEGDEQISREFAEVAERAHNIYFYKGYSDELSRKVYASMDFLLMPSLYEPCGLNQMIASRYGAIPIVRKTGGLKDSVCDYREPERGKALGIVYEQSDFLSMLGAFVASLALFCDTNRFENICKKNMKIDFGWEKSAREYVRIYKSSKEGCKCQKRV